MNGRDRITAALSGKPVDRPPIWFMRQAGRYLPEYQAVRAQHTFEETATSPELATKVTVQPVHRFDLDAAIIFSDILVPLTGMGREASFPGEGGPRIDRPVNTPADVKELSIGDPWKATPYVPETIRLTRQALPDKAVFGFAGAPFTLASYLIEGGHNSKSSFAKTKSFAYQHPGAFRDLLHVCAETAARHLKAQIEAGADAVQLFDTWAEILGPREYQELVLPSIQHVFKALSRERVPRIYFARGTPHLLPYFPETGATAFSLDWRVSIASARELLGQATPLQGNLDPTILFAPPDRVARETRAVLEDGAGGPHVFNLGHGILPGTPIPSVEAMVRTVQTWKGA
ncbi:MAG TPA: uroporphyrinogen decarboxylase [Candidatus Thermoplasmatota archaeon]|nr:uroporphyrinogen decarboxylase [Candidatus Thermoplasmatota archaeon]